MRARLLLLPVALVSLALTSCGDDGSGPTLPSGLLPTTTVPGDVPATEPPATEPPATEPPATEPPATEPPATEPPATEPPATEPPATEVPSTLAPTEPSDGGEGSTWWVWLLGLAAVVGVVVFVVARRKGGQAPWPQRVTATLDQVDAIARRLAAAPEGIGATASLDAQQLATQVVALQQLAAEAPDPALRAGLDQVHAATSALHYGVNAVALSVTPPTWDRVEQLRADATRVYTATATTRAQLAAHTS